MKKLVTVFCLLLLMACSKNRLDVDVSDVNINEVKILRLEKDLFNMNNDSIQANTPIMLKKYGKFYVRFVTEIINKGGVMDSSYSYNLKQFISDKDMRSAYDLTQKKYKDVSELEEGLTEAFKHYNYYFPEKYLPKVVSLMSGFNYAIVNIDSTLGIGLEMYLGSENEFYKMIQFPKYKTMTMREEYILADAVKGWMSTEFERRAGKSDFLNEIIHEGKIMYLTDALLPKVDDTLKMAYSGDQLGWAMRNEFNIWSYLIKENVLYSTDYNEIQKFVSEAPFTAAINKDCPPRIGTWIGWQIVRNYMNRNEDITLKELINEPDAQKILTLSKYKPEK